jgi:hypothetical protein
MSLFLGNAVNFFIVKGYDALTYSNGSKGKKHTYRKRNNGKGEEEEMKAK